MFRDSVPPPSSIVPREPLIRLLQQSRLVTSTPLNTKLLLVVRAPLTLGEMEALSFDNNSLMSADTPGSITSSCVKLRAEVGNPSSSHRSKVRTTVADPEETISALAVTSTVWSTAPTSNTTFTVAISAVVTVTPSRASFLNPWASNTMR